MNKFMKKFLMLLLAAGLMVSDMVGAAGGAGGGGVPVRVYVARRRPAVAVAGGSASVGGASGVASAWSPECLGTLLGQAVQRYLEQDLATLMALLRDGFTEENVEQIIDQLGGFLVIRAYLIAGHAVGDVGYLQHHFLRPLQDILLDKPRVLPAGSPMLDLVKEFLIPLQETETNRVVVAIPPMQLASLLKLIFAGDVDAFDAALDAVDFSTLDGEEIEAFGLPRCSLESMFSVVQAADRHTVFGSLKDQLAEIIEAYRQWLEADFSSADEEESCNDAAGGAASDEDADLAEAIRLSTLDGAGGGGDDYSAAGGCGAKRRRF